MRSLQECQAEVFRRGERKIKQRRRRRAGILLACVPLVVCLFLLPKGDKAEEGLKDQKLSVVQVQIGDLIFRDPAEIRQFMGLMEGCSVQQSIADSGLGNVEPEAAPETLPEAAPPTESPDIDEDAVFEGNFADRHMAHETDKGHTITLMMSDGTKIAYFLLENMLTDLQTGRVTVLSTQQAQALRRFIEEQ